VWINSADVMGYVSRISRGCMCRESANVKGVWIESADVRGVCG
jgi:hypothetical protein